MRSTIVNNLVDNFLELGGDNTALVGTWLRVRQGWGIGNQIIEGEIYFVFSVGDSNVCIVVVDELGTGENIHAGRFEKINPETVTGKEEYLMALWQIKTEIGL